MKNALTLFVIFCVCLALLNRDARVIVKAGPVLFIVGEDGFDSIQEAINSASSGDIIFVRKGVYRENIVINKTLTLIGEDRENTIIDGGYGERVISICAPNVSISGFSIKNSKEITGYGIFVEYSQRVVIRNNTIKDNGIGIHLIQSSESQIQENLISANRVGIQLSLSTKNVISRNAITTNIAGIFVYYSNNNTFCGNTIQSNNFGVFIYYYGGNNVFYHNNFVKNERHVYYIEQNISNLWSYNREGNYWDVYDGKDANSDGIGDTPYSIDNENEDFHPLMGRCYTFGIPYKEIIYYVTIMSNATISNLTFKITTEFASKMLLFNSNVANNMACFARITIPRSLMDTVHMVSINNEKINVTFLKISDERSICLYFVYWGNCSVKVVYLELLDLYLQLLASYSELINRFYALNESFSTIAVLNSSNAMLIRELNSLNEIILNQVNNLRGLVYIFALSTAIFAATTIYLSKKVHERQRREES